MQSRARSNAVTIRNATTGLVRALRSREERMTNALKWLPGHGFLERPCTACNTCFVFVCFIYLFIY